jgi:hypothetical protein
MTEKVVLALMAKRAEIQGHIQDLETKARRWRTRLAHVDATLVIFSPDTDPEAIQPKRPHRRSQYFRGGEFARKAKSRGSHQVWDNNRGQMATDGSIAGY